MKILTREEGRIAQLPYYEGDRVHKGDLLLRLDDTLLQAQLEKAVAQRRQAQLDLKRVDQLQRRQLVAEEAIARARTALDVAQAEEDLLRTRLSYTRQAAPFDGVVSDRLAEPGDAVPRFTHVLTVIDPTSLVTEVNVSELLLSDLAVGDPVAVRIDALGGTPYTGHIQRIHPQVDPTTRQGTVEVTLQPAPKGARAGQLCRVTLRGHPAQRLTVPFAALRRDSGGPYVLRIDEGKAVRTAVATGINLEDRVEVLQGIDEGQQVVTKGFLGLTEATPVQVVDSLATRAGGAQ